MQRAVLQLLGIGLSNGAMIALNAIGVTLVYGAVRTINFAYGDIFALATVLISTLIGSLGLRWGVPLGWLIGGLVLVLAGWYGAVDPAEHRRRARSRSGRSAANRAWRR